jgi:TP901 family phage tail tape measure protein/lambda family phage tail tape measure protein
VSVVANVAINVDSRGAVSKLRQVQTQSQQTERAVEGLSRAFGGLAAAFGAGFALTKVVADVKELDTNLRRLGTVGGNVAALDKGLGALSDRLDGVANKAELAAASYQALSAGFTETGANLRVVEAATKAAVGGLADITGVVDVTTKVLNAYNMSGDQATKVTDSISKAVEFGQVQWSDYTSQLGRVASVAAIAGVSLDEVNAFVAAATKNGATAEVAFTGLGSTLATILKPSKESADAAKQLGINWTLAGIKGEGFESLMGKLAKAMQENPELATQMVGGQEAVRGAFAAASKGGKDYAMILEGLGGAAGKTDADFQTMKGSLENTLKALDTSFKNLSEALGTAFGPTVVIAVQDITKAVNGFADFMAMVPQPVMNTVGTIVKLVAQILLVQKAIQGVIALKAGVAGMLAATAASATAAGTAAGGAATKVNMLKGAMLGLLRFGLVTLAIEIVVSGLGKLAEVQARMNAITKGSTKQFAEQAGGSATSRQEIQNLQKQNREERARRVEEQKSVRFPLLTAQDDIARQAITQLDTRFAQLQTMGERARFATPADRARADATPAANAMNTPVGATVGGGGGRAAASGASKAADEAKRAAEKKRRAAEELANLQGQVTLKEKLFGIDKQIAVEKQRGSIVTAAALEMDKALEERQARIAEITRSTADTATKNAQIKEATLDADQKIYAVQQAIKEQEAERTKSFNEIIAGLDLELALKTATTEQAREQLRLAYELAKLQGQGFTPEQIGAITAKKTELARPKTDRERLEGAAAGVKAELDALTDPINMITTAAAGIGDAFSTSFKGIVSGSMTAKEALASFFTSVADMFLDMAAQIITKMITMAILNAVLGVLPGGDPAKAGGDWIGAVGRLSPNADGNAFGANGIIPFAKGGIVNSPTVFPFAKGIGLMGEAGPEAILPLKRGADGSLGVMASGGGGDVNVVVNVDAKGSSVEGDEQGANQLGRVISAAVQSELIKQQRPGGILAR